MKNYVNQNCIKSIVIAIVALLVLSSCGIQTKNSSDYNKIEKIPHIFDKDYKPYDKRPVVEDIIVEEEEDGEDVVIIIDNEDNNDQASSSIDHCVASNMNSTLIQNLISENEYKAFNLALYISGSFEGKESWKNITNNFDGQGLSLGLFQQNLGQGSLQPLILKAVSNNPEILNKHFTKPQQTKLINMLDEWLENEGALIARAKKNIFSRAIASIINSFTANNASSVRNSISVNWALDNLYKPGSKGKKLKSEWKKAFQSFANDPDYIIMQQEAAMVIHDRALNYMQTYNTKSLVSYLFFFDVVVQNGSMRGLKYTKVLAKQSEIQRLRSLLKSRVELSRKKYQSIVRDRKNLILSGYGTAQARNRNLIEETCLRDWSKIKL